MSVEQLDKIDFISTDTDGKIVLTISDHLDWSDENTHLLTLQDKLNAYLNFIESGQLVENYPNAENRMIIINTVMQFAPPNSILKYLNEFSKFIEEAGFEFNWKLL